MGVGAKPWGILLTKNSQRTSDDEKGEELIGEEEYALIKSPSSLW